MKKFFKKWGALVMICSALFIVVIDTTIINVSISDVVKDLDSDIPTMQWVITIYALVMASLLLIGGKLGDIYGRKKLFVIGVIIYGIGTLTAAFSQNMTMLLIGWALLEGIGGAMMMPASQSLLMDNYKKHDRSLAFGVWGATAGLAVAFGPIFGGYLTTNASWRWAFGLEVLIVMIVLTFAFMIKENYIPKKMKLDYIGGILSALGLASLVYGILQAREYGWWGAKKVFELGNSTIDIFGLSISPVLIFIGITFFILTIVWIYWREKRSLDPLFSLKIFKFSSFNESLLTLFLKIIPMGGIMFIFPVFWQVVRNYNALETGLTFLPYSIAMIVMAPVCGRLAKKIPVKYIIQVGLVLSGVGVFMMIKSIGANADMWDMFLPVGVYGMGMAMMMTQIQNVILSSVDKEHVGEASGLNSTSRQLAQSLGTAVLGTIFLSLIVTNFTDSVESSQVFPEEQKSSIIEGLEAQAEKLGGKTEDSQEVSLPEEITNEIQDLRDEAIADAVGETLYYALIFIGLSFLLSFWLPKNVSHKE